ncbi:FtsB family cell division protein [Pseudarthrobacter sulfonivorans]|uniref:FtsB family cell division protein n=1 Tax=Pseudarthrobacter sulfonivorans TaxID=121292 RepID=UPI002106F9C6|nr:septum formation initiator family protein [Pseudarthrobacter sulfonivorans]
MATRRPKVPKAAATHRGAADRPQEADTADVIRAHFGGTKDGSGQGKHNPSEGTPAKPARAQSGTGAQSGAGARAKAGSSGGGTSKGGPSRGAAKNPAAAASRGSSAGDGSKDDGHDDTQPVPAKAFSGRMLALAVVMIAITIMLAPTVKIFFDKRAELTALSDDIAARQAEGDRLRQQISRWQDPNYVKQQARDRINMVMPGETGYWVFGSDLPAGSSSSQNAAAAQDPADLPWVDSLWESVRRAATD